MMCYAKEQFHKKWQLLTKGSSEPPAKSMVDVVRGNVRAFESDVRLAAEPTATLAAYLRKFHGPIRRVWHHAPSVSKSARYRLLAGLIRQGCVHSILPQRGIVIGKLRA